ncbi:ribonucleotide-diphosphate reductase subunit alpha [Arachnia propionica]|uniref:Ribonucleotide-diphosphate reductase subunit alpha n=1 Tax=Arachnia propionica TaxID=1750 RepID=A0A3P1TCS7_9ACTN|nr:ribonucleotide-diphosphate reductase subunit alpha [Arachnia propionica]RRD07005.1 ribonucleotide-diphosphate reductase subunit alpha [Arachnia propionica]
MTTLLTREAGAVVPVAGERPGHACASGLPADEVQDTHRDHTDRDTVIVPSPEETLDRLIEEGHHDPRVFDRYDLEFIESLFRRASARGPGVEVTHHTCDAPSTLQGAGCPERFEDRVCMVALSLAAGDRCLAEQIVDEILSGRFHPDATMFLNVGRVSRGELMPCILLRVEDTLESIAWAVNSSLQLSGRGGVVALSLTNVREVGAPPRAAESSSTGIIPVMRLLEDSFACAGAPGAGAVCLHAHHPEILSFLEAGRAGTDGRTCLENLSLGVVVPDITFELAHDDQEMQLFSPHDVARVHGVPLSEIEVSRRYHELVADDRIRKTTIKAREFFEAVAKLQLESGWPYLVFEDAVNRDNPIRGWVTMSDADARILQVATSSHHNEDLSSCVVGKDISCPLGSLDIAAALESPDLGRTVETAVRVLTAVSDQSDLGCVPSVDRGTTMGHAIGLGQVNLHGCLTRESIRHGSDECRDFTDMYFRVITYHALWASCRLAKERRTTFEGFERSTYATGEYFDKYLEQDRLPRTKKVAELFTRSKIVLPTRQDWLELAAEVARHGLYNQNLQAVSLPGHGVDPEKVIDTCAEAVKHVDQGVSPMLVLPGTATTQDLTRLQRRAWRSGLKTLCRVRVERARPAGDGGGDHEA